MTMSTPSGMGRPKNDCPTPHNCRGNDDLVDVYLLATDQCKVRGGSCDNIPPQRAVARAVPDTPGVLNSSGRRVSSGYILLDRRRAADPATLKNDLAHEFFHVLQFAHNLEAFERDTGAFIGNDPIRERSWFVEASATWAEWRYVPATAGVEVHPLFVEVFQADPGIGLQSLSPFDHPAAAYIWPFFMQQEVGDHAIFQ